MDNKNSTLFKYSLGVRPLPAHPMYYELEFGFLFVWLFAEDEEAAMRRAIHIIEETNLYELTEQNENGDVKVRVYKGPIDKESKLNCNMHRAADREARGLGFALHFEGWPVGCDEPDGLFIQPKPKPEL